MNNIEFDRGGSPLSDQEPNFITIDATLFQEQLGKLAEVIAQKVRREAPGMVAGPAYITADMHVMLRQAIYTYHLMFFLNADDNPYRKNQYSVVAFPLIRSMIDCLYNITAILDNPAENGPRFRRSGLKNAFNALDEDEKKYGGKAEWDNWIKGRRQELLFEMRTNNIELDDVLAESMWPTMGTYVKRLQAGGVTTPHQDFLKSFTYLAWREYSAMAHCTFEGLMLTGVFFIPDKFSHEQRPKIDEAHSRMVFLHISRVAAILLCIITEIQAHFKFDGANINERIHEIWDVLQPVAEIKELYSDRYQQLMHEKLI
ncbi:MAG TPA: hypothetical protein VGK36_01850 [Candidatus Angelobacter sp.]